MTKLEKALGEMKKSSPSLKLNRTFYFDESNNIRKGIIGAEKDNNDLQHLYFVLGGIATKEPINFNSLLEFIGVKQIPNDAKYKFFTQGNKDFLDSIKQKRLRKLFEYLENQDIIIHFAVEHYFHFALIDILDSLIAKISNERIQATAIYYYRELQSDVMEVLYQNYELFHETLVKYGYPNIPELKVGDFVRDILELYIEGLSQFDLNDPNNFTKELLRQIIKASCDNKKLIFLEDNQPYVISSIMTHMYLQRMYNFKDKKYFDNEVYVENELLEMDNDFKNKLNTEFCDSKEKREIQISDVISGFVGRLFKFISKMNETQITDFIDKLDIESESYKTLKAFFNLMTKSDDESVICFLKVIPLFIERRFRILFELIVGKNANK